MDLGSLVGHVVDARHGEEDDETRRRVLDAALAEAAAVGLRGVTVDGVARRAQVNRVTVYRRFGDRDGLLGALMVREGARIARAIDSAVRGIDDPVTAFVESFVAALRVAREHPFISWASQHEPAELLHAGSADDAATLRLGTALIAGRIRELQVDGIGKHLDPDAIGETIARLFAMLLLLPTQVSIDVGTDSAARTYTRGLLLPLLTDQPREA